MCQKDGPPEDEDVYKFAAQVLQDMVPSEHPGTKTGRMDCKKPNLSNISVKPIDNGFSEDSKPMRRFYLQRTKDETGISRTGRVLEGVVTQSGQVIVQWRPPHTSIGVYNDMDEFLGIHVTCHPSCSEVVWLDGVVDRPLSNAFHHLWTKAVGTPDYVKDEWKELMALLAEHGIVV